MLTQDRYQTMLIEKRASGVARLLPCGILPLLEHVYDR